jgi:hypothetical protein
VALPKIRFNEGSLLRRTLLHIGTFVLGSMAFIGVASFILVSIAKGLVSPPRAEAAEEEPAAAAAATSAPGSHGAAPLVRPGAAAVRPAAKRPIPAASPARND